MHLSFSPLPLEWEQAHLQLTAGFLEGGREDGDERALWLMPLGLSPEVQVTWIHVPPSALLPMASGSPHGGRPRACL